MWVQKYNRKLILYNEFKENFDNYKTSLVFYSMNLQSKFVIFTVFKKTYLNKWVLYYHINHVIHYRSRQVGMPDIMVNTSLEPCSDLINFTAVVLKLFTMNKYLVFGLRPCILYNTVKLEF